MKGKAVFGKSQQYDLDKAIAIAGENGLKDGESFILKHFEVINSRKYNESFVIIETDDGRLLSSWSKVIVDKFNQLAGTDAKEYKGLELALVVAESAKGRTYYDLEVVE